MKRDMLLLWVDGYTSLYIESSNSIVIFGRRFLGSLIVYHVTTFQTSLVIQATRILDTSTYNLDNSHQRSLDSANSRPDNCTYKFQAEVSRLDNSQTSPFCTTNSTQRLWSWWVICRQFYMVLVFIIEYTLHDWVHSSWLAVLSMTDCTLHDWLQSSWSTVISITDCILHDWLCSPPLTVLFTIDSNLDYWLQSPWLTVNSLTDCTFHDSLYSPWLIVLFMIDCTLHNWFNSSWLIALSVS